MRTVYRVNKLSYFLTICVEDVLKILDKFLLLTSRNFIKILAKYGPCVVPSLTSKFSYDKNNYCNKHHNKWRIKKNSIEAHINILNTFTSGFCVTIFFWTLALSLRTILTKIRIGAHIISIRSVISTHTCCKYNLTLNYLLITYWSTIYSYLLFLNPFLSYKDTYHRNTASQAMAIKIFLFY